MWDHNAYARLLNTSWLQLNIHKMCNSSHQPVTFRFAKLINSRSIVLSERAYPKDEEEFGEMVSFVKFDDIPREYARLAGMAAEERRRLARSRSSLFAERFHPQRIFSRAGVYAILERVMAKASNTRVVCPRPT